MIQFQSHLFTEEALWDCKLQKHWLSVKYS